MKRDGFLTLSRWLAEDQIRLLLIGGVRGVGKTHLVRQVARAEHRNLIELNFERYPLAGKLFRSSNTENFQSSLEAHEGGRKIDPSTALLFLDEIHASSHVVDSLAQLPSRFPGWRIVAASSFVDTISELRKASPSSVQQLRLEPLTFEEFLGAIGKEALLNDLSTFALGEALDQRSHTELSGLYSDYLRIGGFPSAVERWREGGSASDCREAMQDQLDAIQQDFQQYAGRMPTDRMGRVFHAIPELIGKKFTYARVPGEEKAAAVRKTLDRLRSARVCRKVVASKGRELPLTGETRDRFFKMISVDVGLVHFVLTRGKEPASEITRARLYDALMVQATGQALAANDSESADPCLFYWARDRKGSEAEVDYLIESQGRIVPIVISSGAVGTLRALHLFMNERDQSLAIRLGSETPAITTVKSSVSKVQKSAYCLVSLPVYMTGQIHRLLSEVTWG